MRVFVGKPGFLLARIDQIGTALYGDLSAGETLAQAEFLLLIDALASPDQISLARSAGVDKSTTAVILDNLAAGGLIRRIPDETDRRRTRPALTEAGRRRLAETRGAFAALQDSLTAPLSRAERDELVALLHPVAADTESPAPCWTPPGETPLDEAPSFLCRRALQVSQAHFLACTAPLNLTPRQFSALFIFHAHPGFSQVDFARLFGLDPSTCAVIIRNLAARRLLVGRVSRSDRRKRLYSLTDAGRETLVEAQPLVDRSERLTLGALDDAAIARLIGLLQSIVRAHSRRLRFPGALLFDDLG